MPPTPPPTSTDNNREQLDTNYPDARHYQLLPDSPDSPPTPPPLSEARKQQLHQQSQSNLLGDPTNLHSSPDDKQGLVRERAGSLRVKGSEVPLSSVIGEAFATEDLIHSDSDLLVPEDGDGHSRTDTRAAPAPPAVATASTSATTTTVTVYACPPIIPDPVEKDDGEGNDEFYDLTALRSAGLYRRSGARDQLGKGQAPAGLVRRGIGIVKRDEVGDYARRDGDINSSTTLGSGRLQNAELAGRYGALSPEPLTPPCHLLLLPLVLLLLCFYNCLLPTPRPSIHPLPLFSPCWLVFARVVPPTTKCNLFFCCSFSPTRLTCTSAHACIFSMNLAQTRSPPQHPTSTTFQNSPVHSHSSDQSVSEEEENSEVEEEEEEDDMEEEESWIGNFCSMLGHEYFAEVTEEFIEDDFNLTGLGQMVPM